MTIEDAILVCLGIGLLLQSLANFVHWAALYQVGAIAQVLLGPAFGVAIATMLNSNTLVTFSVLIAKMIESKAAYLSR
ncbi:PTS sugar transporter subunit IIC, partial [Lactiplantibacillus plantarum]|uniref:PTS sugar transporter subunit IIC n=1 Tax=Lactiplantibacillus plantarum TaxID=1590 RepID=UPI000B21F9CE